MISFLLLKFKNKVKFSLRKAKRILAELFYNSLLVNFYYERMVVVNVFSIEDNGSETVVYNIVVFLFEDNQILYCAFVAQ